MSSGENGLPTAVEGSDSDAQAALPISQRLTRARRRLAGLRQLRREQVEQIRRADEQLQNRQERLQELATELQDHSRDLQTRETNSLRRRSHKRQKTHHPDTEPKPSGFHDFSYGIYGQTLPGSLRLEVVSCDGGEYLSDHRSTSYLTPRTSNYLADSYRITNVLKDDKSVYCTTSSRCNLLLCHVGESIFTLDRVVIKAPEAGYTAPIQQGLIFVGNDAEELLTGTDSYAPKENGVLSSRDRDSSLTNHPRESDRLSLLESLHDDALWQAHLHRDQRRRLEGLQRHLDDATAELTQYFGHDIRDENLLNRLSSTGWTRSRGWTDICDWPALEPARADDVTRAPTPPAFTIVNNRSSPDVVEEAMNPSLYHAQTDHETSPDISGDEEETILQALAYHNDFGSNSRLGPAPSSARPHDNGASTSTFSHANITGNVMALRPNASFFIGRKKSKISIKFDPPVSGRFLLLKLFSPTMKDGGNIDIQFVGAYGYSGPRFFPALTTK